MEFKVMEITMNNEPTEYKYGRWFITLGQSGFNSPANNRNGYDSDAKARAAIARYTARGIRARSAVR